MDSKNDDYDSNFSYLNTTTTSLFSPSSSASPPSARAVEEDTGAETRLYRARLILENHLYDELLSRYKLTITRLREVTSEANALREENAWLRLANDHLARRKTGPISSSETPKDHNVVGVGNEIVGSSSPTSVINNGGDHEEEIRVSLPKSISVRSPRYFKLANSQPPPLPLVVTSNQSLRPSQETNDTRLRMQGDVEKAIELDVHNQGMYKTELCNKWEETGVCPYRESCQFAHGLPELRPVIRHPRYKTQVCRMILTGVKCPYGHRCHFRHSLSQTTS